MALMLFTLHKDVMYRTRSAPSLHKALLVLNRTSLMSIMPFWLSASDSFYIILKNMLAMMNLYRVAQKECNTYDH